MLPPGALSERAELAQTDSKLFDASHNAGAQLVALWNSRL
jgi:hypothetical protein